MGRLFAEVADLCEKLEATSSRNNKIFLVAGYLRSFNPSESQDAKAAAYLLVGFSSGIRRMGINIGPSTLMKAFDEKQSFLDTTEPLTVAEVWETVKKAQAVSGDGSAELRTAYLTNLFSRGREVERKWLFRMILGEMRHGVNAGLLLEAVAEAFGKPVEDVRTADMLLGDLGELVKKAVENRLDEVRLSVFKPVKPMLAEYAYSVSEVVEELGVPVLIEPKIDGVRVQIHKSHEDVKVYSRGLRDLTAYVPDIVETVKRSVKADTAIFDAEAYCVDEKGRPAPFQETMRRIGREKNVEAALKEMKLDVRLFDVLYLDGKEVWAKPLSERRMLLEQHVNNEVVNEAVLANDSETISTLLDKWVNSGYEGLMAKNPKSIYTLGRRGGYWLKLKPAHTLDVVIVAAEWGHGRRKGWLSNYHLAVIDEKTGRYIPVGKTFKGLTDQEFREITQHLLSIKIRDVEWGVVVQPKLVLEIEFNEVQKSPRYPAGYALRFARVKRIRYDKLPEEADTLATVEHFFRKTRKVFSRDGLKQ